MYSTHFLIESFEWISGISIKAVRLDLAIH